ncbi:MAG: transglycosylase SLT domain-containing protein [Phocaeicola sp.]
MKQLIRFNRLIGILFLCIGIWACTSTPKSQAVQEERYDLQQIKDSGVLTVLTLSGSTTYFDYRGETMGFQYELAEQFANYIGVKLAVKVAPNVQELVRMLQDKEGDLIAYNLAMTKELKDSILFCGESVITHQVLIQRQDKNSLIKDVIELIDKEVYVKPSKYAERLNNLNQELGGGIQINLVENDSISTEDLIAKVSKGEIEYTVCDNDLARLNKTYYANLNIGLAISFDQRASWAVRKESSELAALATQWHNENNTSLAYQASSKRYFEMSKQLIHSPILSITEGKISHYDDFFKKYAKEIGWDWRLLAALAYTESNFDATVISWAGAQGLMQLMPRTARAMGVPKGKEQDPEESIKAAVKYIGITSRSFQNVRIEEQRVKFTLAAYNAGVGHVFDAMALTEKHGKDKYQWDKNVAEYILLKSNEEYFNDPICKNGYLRGSETYAFVQDVITRADIYRKKVKE